MEFYYIFLFGFIGGCMPEGIRIHRIVSSGGFIQFQYPGLYIFMSFVMAIFGGILAIAFDSPNILNAIWIGASTPLIITTFSKISPV